MSPGWTGPLLDHLWQSTWFAAACALLALALRRREAQLRTTFWSAAILKFLVPWPVLAALGDAVNVWSRTDVPPARPNGAFYAELLTRPFTLARFATPEPAESGWLAHPVIAAAVAVWAAGAAFVAVRWAVRWLRLRRVVRRAVPAGSGRELDVFRRAQQCDPRYAHVTLALTEEPIGPGVAGSVWPVVLWPRAMSPRLSDDEMAAVFVHELCHVRRRDNLVSSVCRAVEALFWFHPAIWMLGRYLQDERERACDEGVVAGTRPDVYAEALVKTCQFHLEAPLTCAATGPRATFSERVARILRGGESRPVPPWVRRGLALTVAGALGLPVAVAAVMPPELVGLGPNRLLQAPQLLVAWAPRGSSPGAPGDERFVSVSVRPAASRTPGGLQAFGGGRLAGTAVSPGEIVRTAYGGSKMLRAYQVVGLPEWAHRERFDVRARAAAAFVNEPSGEPRQFTTMLQHLLTDEFGLVAHRERRVVPAFALVRAGLSLGSGLRRSERRCWRPGEGPVPAIPVHPLQWCHAQFLRNGVTEAASMEWLAGVVGARMPQPAIVVDGTGLLGAYDITWMPPAPGTPLGPSLETQLGLTLEPRSVPLDLLVVDRIERPKESTR
jgi:uncharacterized protein (TIGR03435 family)